MNTATTLTPAGRRISVAIVDDHQVLLDSLRLWLTDHDPGLEVRVCSRTWAGLLSDPGYPVDVVLLDLDLGDRVPVTFKLSMLQQAGVAPVVLSAFGEPAAIRTCIAAGALTFVSKGEDPTRVLQAIRLAAAGEGLLTQSAAEALAEGSPSSVDPHLSPQERRALVLYATGLTLKSVARRMGVSYESAKSYLDRVRAKYEAVDREARTKVELRIRAEEDGLVSPGGALSPPGDSAEA